MDTCVAVDDTVDRDVELDVVDVAVVDDEVDDVVVMVEVVVVGLAVEDDEVDVGLAVVDEEEGDRLLVMEDTDGVSVELAVVEEVDVGLAVVDEEVDGVFVVEEGVEVADWVDDDVEDVTDTVGDVGVVCLVEVVFSVEGDVVVKISADVSCGESDVDNVASDDDLVDSDVD